MEQLGCSSRQYIGKIVAPKTEFSMRYQGRESVLYVTDPASEADELQPRSRLLWCREPKF